ncbi:hypothetical protein [Methanoregula sp. UBA64]|jgi:hypothetical protein|uniref:hypothetical protein n=1 Tax=Methanoregula sp. UBA64 TaxID=1915554 RepID=UPI0025F02633|nr:hypothetical protein [Methanoregula sp. UBA64]
MHRAIKSLAAIIVVLLAVALAAGYIYTRQSVVVPHIVPQAGTATPITATHSFLFENSKITISVPVDAGVYAGAKATDKSVSIYGNVSESTWVTDSYLAMVNDTAQDAMYESLLSQFNTIKNNRNLTSDEYLELMAAYVQSLTYETTPDNPAKYPVETVVDGAGDCDDKSLLLAGLLSREGYRVSLFSFSPESHMALGVGSTASPYKDTGYAYLETTNLSYVGVAPQELAGGVVLTSEPLIIPVGDGTTLYESGTETAALNDLSVSAAGKAKALEPKISSLSTDLAAQQDRIKKMEAQMQSLRNSGNAGAYNAQVSAHNALVAAYNSELATYRGLVSTYDAYAQVHNYIVSHAYDRKGTYAWAMANMPS